MILQSITIRDYGVYEGENKCTLTPKHTKNRSKPIILFYGHNGSGKTTMFEAFTLCIYGQYFKGQKMKWSEYASYIRKRIHKGPDGSTKNDASITLVLTINERGIDTVLEIKRSWILERKRKIKEIVEILASSNDRSKHYISEPEQFLMGLFPIGVSQLVFFDGERIKSFVEGIESNVLFKDGFLALNGVDIVKKAIRDLSLYSVKLREKDDHESTRDWDILEKEIESLEKKKDQLNSDVVKLSSEIDNARIKISGIEQRLAREGSAYADKRHSSLAREKILEHKLLQTKRELISLTEGVLPFAFAPTLVKQSIESMKEQEEIEEQRKSAKVARKITTAFEEEVRKGTVWKGRENNPEDFRIAGSVATLFRVLDRFAVEPENSSKMMLHHISSEELRQIINLLEDSLSEIPKQLRVLSSRLQEHTKGIAEARDEISRIPDDQILRPIVEELHDNLRNLTRLEDEKTTLEEALTRTQRDIEQRKGDQERVLEEITGNARHLRKIRSTKTSISALRSFKSHLQEYRLRNLNDTLLELYNQLRPHDKRIDEICVDPDSFFAEIKKNGVTTDSSTLSAGEKQLFAIALLGAISRSSTRMFPFLFDTPLARLDKKHRSLVVSQFFPFVSDQVILFATNTEATKKIREIMKPNISRTYRLSFNGRLGRTAIREMEMESV